MSRRELILSAAVCVLLALLVLLVVHLSCPTCQRKWIQARRKTADFFGELGARLME